MKPVVLSPLLLEDDPVKRAEKLTVIYDPALDPDVDHDLDPEKAREEKKRRMQDLREMARDR